MGGAGSAQVNGWYRRRESTEGPPRAWVVSMGPVVPYWETIVAGRQWYEKDDDCYIYWSHGYREWLCLGGGEWYYRQYRGGYVYGETNLPLAEGWIVDYGVDPAPTLRVVS